MFWLLLAGCARVTSGAAAPAAGGAPAADLAAAAAPAAESATVPTPCPQPESAKHPVDRVAGADRYATAVCASRAAFPASTSGTVVLARGDDAGAWADALAGTVLAEAVDGPVLLTDPARLPEPTSAELGRLQPRTVLVLGGEAAVSEAVAAQVRAAAPAATVRRIAGPDRYATAAAVSAEAGTGGTAFVVNGFRPADALVAGAPAARAGAALLLVGDAGVPPVTADALRQVRDVTIVGGYGVVPANVEAQLAELVGRDHLRRVSGGDRTETAASVARAFPVDGRLHLANGGRLVDAIGAGWSAARAG
ncbi:MAG TPA: cell wall-binding repeat-containing protein, partial [Nitriliruptorales bacterium]|nr:cell wall-binding repeat-containing protein [Nitriliruptorales bacterium]